jgi:hypothetical protein
MPSSSHLALTIQAVADYSHLVQLWLATIEKVFRCLSRRPPAKQPLV